MKLMTARMSSVSVSVYVLVPRVSTSMQFSRWNELHLTTYKNSPF